MLDRQVEKEIRKSLERVRKVYYKSFIFRQGIYDRYPVTEALSSRDYDRRRYDLTVASYKRFVDLANSGKYNLRVLPEDEGFGWEIFRVGSELKADRPITIFTEEKT